MSTHSDELDQQQLSATGLVARIEYYTTLGSTQDRALEVARSAVLTPLPLLVVAEQQTAGRGRGANSWWTGAGSLAFSLLFDPAEWSVSRKPVPARSLAVGVAIVEAASELVPNHRVGLHWPNDVFVDDKKLAGILIDVLPSGHYVIGVGINVNNPFDQAPDEVRARAVSLMEIAGRRLDRTALLSDVLRNIKANLIDLASGQPEYGERFNQLCLQRGRELTVEVGPRLVTGRCAGLSHDGALILETAEGLEAFYSGVLR